MTNAPDVRHNFTLKCTKDNLETSEAIRVQVRPLATRHRLCGHGDPGISADRDRHCIGTDSVGGGQHDLHNFDQSGHPKRKKTSLSRFRRVLKACRVVGDGIRALPFPVTITKTECAAISDTEYATSIVSDDQKTIVEISDDQRTTVEISDNQKTIVEISDDQKTTVEISDDNHRTLPESTSNSTVTVNCIPTASTETIENNLVAEIFQPVEIMQASSSRYSITTARAKICRCFSPNASDDEEEMPDEQHVELAEQALAVRSTVAVGQVPVSTTASVLPSSSRFMQMARELRSRLAMTGADQSQSAPISHMQNGSGLISEHHPYPVHSTVEYTHYLVPDIDKVFAATYYWGVMDRYEAEKLLESKPEGTFLLRDSAQNDYIFSVSFRRYQRTLHARIDQKGHKFSFDSYDDTFFSAPTITELVDNYKDPQRCLFFEPQLTHPLHRTTPFSLQTLCRAKIASNVSYDDVDSLNLPGQMRSFIKEYHYKQPIRVTTAMTTSTTMQQN